MENARATNTTCARFARIVPARMGRMQNQMYAGPHPLLGIEGLPERFDRLSPGMIYAIAVEQQALRFTLLVRALGATLALGSSAALVWPFDASALLRKAHAVNVDLEPALRSRRLRLVTGVDPGAELAQPGLLRVPRRVFGELRELGLPAGSLVVLDHADACFGLTEATAAAAAAATYQEWVDANDYAMLALFAPRPQATREALTLRAIAETFGGFAMVKTIEEEAVLDVRHWFGSAGAVMRSSYRLELGASGAISARPVATGGRVSIDPGKEQNVVTRAAADGFTESTSAWQIADGFIDVIHRARTILAGTVVLDFDRTSALRDLAQTVAALRSLGRPQLRIVVRECGARLRLVQLVALLRLGVSMVIPKDVVGVAARLMAESMRGSLLTRACDDDVAGVIERTRADLPPRALRIDQFRQRVEDLMQVGSDAEIPHTLVRFSTVSPQAMRAAQNALQRGARDALFAEHDRSLWVFLFGCSVDNAHRVLARLLGARFEKLMLSWQRLGSATEILRTLALLEHAVVDPAEGAFADTVTLLHDAALSLDAPLRPHE